MKTEYIDHHPQPHVEIEVAMGIITKPNFRKYKILIKIFVKTITEDI